MAKTYSVSETAKLLGYSRNSIYTFLKDGDIKGIRIGQGKIRIPQTEIDKFQGGEFVKSTVSTEDQMEKAEDKRMVEEIVKEAKEDSQPEEPAPLILPTPRPGKSLEELSGEPPLHTLRLWFEERVGIPRLFDWFIGLSSLILGLSMFLHTKQVDALLVGRFSMWFTPIRISLILSGIGLIVADMIQEEFLRYRNLSNYFRGVLFLTFAGLSYILLLGNDVDGFVIYGLFAIDILIEAATGVRSSTTYMLYVQALLICTALIFYFFPADPALSSISSGLFTILDGFRWVWVMVVVSLLMITLYGFFWDKKVLKGFSAFCGVLLTILALYFANNNYWERSFFILIAGMIGMMLPFWEEFKRRFEEERPLVFRMFGIVLMFFSLVIVIIGIVQSILLSDANRNLAEKADLGRISIENTVNDGFSAIEGIAQNPLFIKAFKAKDSDGMDSFTKAIFKNNVNLGVVVILNDSGLAISSYPFSSDIVGRSYANEMFFRNAFTDSRYFSRTVEPMVGVSSNAIILSSPIMEKGSAIGVITATVNVDALGDRLKELVAMPLDQNAVLIDSEGKWLTPPATGIVGGKILDSDTTNLLWSRTTGAEIGYDSLGKYTLFRSSRSKDLSWTVVVTEPIFSILNVSRSGLMVILFLLAVAVLTAAFSYIFSKRKTE